MSDGDYYIHNAYRDRYHIIDDAGETTLCTKFSAWGTINPDYPVPGNGLVRTEKHNADVTYYDKSIRDPGSKLCHICESRSGKVLCPKHKKVLVPKIKATQTTAEIRYLHCQECDYREDPPKHI